MLRTSTITDIFFLNRVYALRALLGSFRERDSPKAMDTVSFFTFL